MVAIVYLPLGCELIVHAGAEGSQAVMEVDPTGVACVADEQDFEPHVVMDRAALEGLLAETYAPAAPPSPAAVTAFIGAAFNLGFLIADASTDGRIPSAPVLDRVPTPDEFKACLAAAYDVDGLALPVPDEAVAKLSTVLASHGLMD